MTTDPAVTPKTFPDASTVAMDGVPLDHVPPLVASLNRIDEAVQGFAEPVMVPAFGEGLTVTLYVA
jgi:hypothetical protein